MSLFKKCVQEKDTFDTRMALRIGLYKWKTFKKLISISWSVIYRPCRFTNFCELLDNFTIPFRPKKSLLFVLTVSSLVKTCPFERLNVPFLTYTFFYFINTIHILVWSANYTFTSFIIITDNLLPTWLVILFWFNSSLST